MKKILATLALALAMFPAARLWAGKSAATVHIAIRVEKFAEWSDANAMIIEADWPGPLNRTHQGRAAARNIILYTNTDALISARPALNDGVLTCRGQTLATAYKITGSVANPDSSFKDSRTFFAGHNAYNVAHQSGVGAYPINLEVQATSPANRAPEEGTYTCGLVLTAAW